MRSIHLPFRHPRNLSAGIQSFCFFYADAALKVLESEKIKNRIPIPVVKSQGAPSLTKRGEGRFVRLGLQVFGVTAFVRTGAIPTANPPVSPFLKGGYEDCSKTKKAPHPKV